MSTQAEVKSIDTLAFVKAALAAFGHETGQSLAEVEMQAQRVVDWICIDQAAHWKMEVRRASDAVNQAMKDLQHCRTYKKVGDNQPACAEEKKALEKARKRLERAERKAAAVRHWTPVVRQQLQETGVRLTRFREVIDVDCPKAVARLERMLRSLDNYAHTAAPRGTVAGGAAASVARPADETATGGQPAAAAPPARGVSSRQPGWGRRMNPDLSSGASKLALAIKQLHLKWESARDTWDDSTSRAFHEEHIEPLAPRVKETLEAIGRLAEVLARATRDVSDTDDY